MNLKLKKIHFLNNFTPDCGVNESEFGFAEFYSVVGYTDSDREIYLPDVCIN